MTKNKKNLGLKVLSTTAALAVLVSSVATPVSVFANETKENIQGSTKVVVNSIIAPSTLNLLIDQDEATLLKVFRNNAKVMHGDAHEIGNPLCVYKDYTLTVSGVNYKVAGTYNALFRASFGKDSVSKYIEVKVAGTGSGTGTNYQPFTDAYSKIFPSGQTEPIETATSNDIYNLMYLAQQYKNELGDYLYNYFLDNMVRGLDYISINTVMKSLNNLFSDKTQSQLAVNVTQKTIDEARTKVEGIVFNKLPESAKNELFNVVQKAQDLLTEKDETNKAEENVNNLFADKEHTTLADGITQKDIDVAKEAANKVTDKAKKEELLNEIQKAQDLLTAKDETNKAEENVNNLFADKEHTTLAEGVTQQDIDAAKEAANKVTDKAKKEELLNEIQKAQDLLTAKDETNKAEENVNNLFADKEHTTLAEGVTQQDIDAAKEAANKVTDKAKKEELLNEIQKAQDLLTAKEEQKAVENVNNLFADGEHTTLADGITQKDIDVAKEAVNKLTDEAKKEELLNEIQKAQDLLTAKEEAGKVAEDVNNLFADKEHTTLADGITQKDIDVAKDQVNKLTDGAKKEELLNEIQKAQDLLTAKEEQKVAEDVNNLFADDEHTILADGITQKDIDVAKDQVNKLIDEAKKEELLNEIQKAQDLLNEMNKLTLNTLTAHSSEISGSARANSQLRISINGVAKTVIKADSEGKYEWRVSKLAVNDVIKVEMRNPETNKYDQFVDQRITDSGVTEEKITLNGMQEGDTKISGTTTPNAQVRINFDGKPKNIVTSDAQGNYEFVVASGLTTGTEIKVELKSKGTYSISETKTVIARVLTLNPITSADDVVISGKTRNPNQKLRISLNGKAKTIISSKEGVYEYRMGKVAADSAIKVEAMNGSTVIESVEQIVKGISNEERPDVKLDAIEAGTRTTITGKAPAKASLRISINGKTKSVVAADAEGNFSYMLGKVQAGDKVKIEIREGKTFVFATEVAAH
ncbi:exported protein of unknown function [Brochothrix thermosphacta]|uniref:toxin Cry1Ac domain D-VI-related protein n=1 Tax=Brochothrix thermosphacta TaxID=2756 RepID=UPI000D77694B|nr:toxin Cry1Ac domain D-VI-related protein [Brochothrix thermosphacta]SPN71252.1 exported protein of unknown function [Brochothrix thermosphacta]